MNYWDQEAAKKEQRKEWLASLKEGDEVAIPDRSHYRRAPKIARVLKVTATQIVVKDYAIEARYNRDDGSKRGTGWGTIMPVTDEVRAQVESAENRDWLRDITYREDKIAAIPPAVLEAMRTAYKDAMAQHDTKPHHEAP